MQTDQLLTFGPYRFDPHTGQLWRSKHKVSLTKKATAVLHYLLERTGQVVPKEELFAVVWADTVVSDAALTSCIQELRQALRDHARKPRYIETVHRRGFCFIGKIAKSEDNPQREKHPQQEVTLPFSPLAPSPQHPAPVLVGRAPDLAFLHARLARALHGERQLVFVTGEPGIGKTTLVDVFVSDIRGPASHEESQKAKGDGLAPSTQNLAPGPWSGRGQCIEHYGTGEAYLPVLEALGRLCRGQGGKEIIALLHQHAPSWLVQMPALLSPAELEELQRRTAGVTRDRMLRELAEALEVITAERPLVLILEDLHWSDVSTLDLLSMLARRQEAARLLIIGTYRPVEVLTREHPLKGIKQELQVHGQCEELALDFLSEAAVADYLAVRFDSRPPHPDSLPQGEREPGIAEAVHILAHLVHQRTDGNPLFMVNVTNELVAQGIITRQEGHWEIQGGQATERIRVPENLRQLIEQQLARVNPDVRETLEAASVVGAEFSAAAVAAGVEHSTEAVETLCDNLVRREQLLRAQEASEWPDGTVAARYSFVHALYQDVLYAQIPTSRRTRLHRQIGEREEQGYGSRAREIAAELAVHFERGREYGKAVQYLQYAGENAVRRSAYAEAATQLTKGLELVETLPTMSERIQQEVALLTTLAPVLATTQGYGTSAVEQAYSRAQELIQQTEESPRQFLVLSGLWNLYEIQGKHQRAYEFGEQLLSLAQRREDSAALIQAHYALAVTLFYLEDLSSALRHADQALTLYDQRKHDRLAFFYGQDPRVACLLFAGHILWSLGYPDQALARNYEAIAWAQELAHPYSLAYALTNTAWRHQLRQEVQAARTWAEESITLCQEHGFPLMLAQGTIWWGWALTEQGETNKGIEQLHKGLAAWRATKAELALPYHFTLLAGAYKKIGRVNEGLAVIAEGLAIAHRNNERWYEAELHRLQGELILQQVNVQSSKFKVEHLQFALHNPHAEAEACFLKAINLAHHHNAKSLELRAVISLVRLRQYQAQDHAPRNTQHVNRTRLTEAHKMLSDIYHWFTEGFDTKDLQEAQALLRELTNRIRS